MKCCKDCEDRYLGCHSKCEKYAEFLKWNDKKKEELKKEKYLYDGLRRRRR